MAELHDRISGLSQETIPLANALYCTVPQFGLGTKVCIDICIVPIHYSDLPLWIAEPPSVIAYIWCWITSFFCTTESIWMGIDVCYSKGKFMITGSFTHTNPFDKPKNALHVSTVLTTSLPAALHLCCLFRRQCIVSQILHLVGQLPTSQRAGKHPSVCDVSLWTEAFPQAKPVNTMEQGDLREWRGFCSFIQILVRPSSYLRNRTKTNDRRLHSQA